LIGKEERLKNKEEAKLSPGPGAYDLNEDKRGSKWKFGTGTRSGLNIGESARNPGPGTYFDKEDKDGKGAKWKFGTGERDNKTTNQVPGPGTYTKEDDRNHGRGYSLGKGERFSTKNFFYNSNPGPGN